MIDTKTILTAAILAAPALAPAPAMAEVVLWKKVAGWDVSFYSGNDGCLAFTTYEEGTAFFIGFNKIDGTHFIDVTLMDNAWGSIEDGKDYAIKAYFGDETPWDLEMTGKDYDGTPGLTGNFNLDDASLLVEEFQRETSMQWMYQGASLGRYTLRGSRVAFDEVLNCQRSYNDAVSGMNDPFSGGPKRAADPFAN